MLQDLTALALMLRQFNIPYVNGVARVELPAGFVAILNMLTMIVLSFFRLGCNAIGDKGADYIGQAVTANASQSVVQILYVCTCMDLESYNNSEGVMIDHLGTSWTDRPTIDECIFPCSLESTEISEAAQDKLERTRQSLDRPSDKELDINYLHHALVVQKRNQTNVT